MATIGLTSYADALCQIRKAAARNAPLCLFAERGVRSFEYARKRQRRN